tara:strand:+ start:2982 stop:3164 length:183 start_codon:yes stop_codon:yes gene_type:complete
MEDLVAVKEYLDEMIEHYGDTSNPLLLERRKTYKDVKIAIFGEEIDDGDTRKDGTQTRIY